MDAKTKCQSCGVQFHEDFGSNADGSKSDVYCSRCFVNGQFTEPDMTLDKMMHKSTNYMIEELKTPFEEAVKMASEIPELKRWKK